MVTAGTRIGSYEVVSLLGSGGMGEVYRARDSRLKREVALKILPDIFSRHPERRVRFQREAEVLAALSHPHVAGIHGLEESNGSTALVLELVEGETLAERIARRPIPVEEALPIARQIAEALEYAHERGIIHRDLKPANIKITPSGTVKVLDFGLAKLSDNGTVSAPDVTASPTLTVMSQAGMLLGTAAYMSPEQARGKEADRRSDVWAFGCVLYEMLTGQRAIEGPEVSDILANVLKSAPDWSRLPAETPAPIRRLLRRCLEKDRAQRATRYRERPPRNRRCAVAERRGRHARRPLGRPAMAGVVDCSCVRPCNRRRRRRILRRGPNATRLCSSPVWGSARAGCSKFPRRAEHPFQSPPRRRPRARICGRRRSAGPTRCCSPRWPHLAPSRRPRSWFSGLPETLSSVVDITGVSSRAAISGT